MLLYFGQNAHKLYTLLEIIAAIEDLFTLLRMRARGVYILCMSRLFVFAGSRVSLHSIRSRWEEHGGYMAVSEIIQRTGKLVSNNIELFLYAKV